MSKESMSSGERSRPASPPAERAPIFTTVARILALQDVMLLGYLLVVWRLVWGSAPGLDQDFCARRVYICIAIVLLGAWCGRGQSGLPRGFRWLVYRIGLAGVLLENYLMLRHLLPLVRPDAVDNELYQLDLRLFGVEPALWLERLNQRPIVEYFSFFYFSYFFICVTYFVVVVMLARGEEQHGQFAIGTLIVFCLGQLGYMAVPAVGPIRHFASLFREEVHGGFFWGCVSATVEAGSAMKDVFPSLHTAVPTWFTLFAFHRAKFDPRWRWPARITGFFAANIVFSTMFLRWHYAIDIVAGLALATTASILSVWLQRLDSSWRSARGFAPAWSF